MIIVIDDNIQWAVALTRLFNEESAVFSVVETALEIVRHEKPRAIILDVNLGDGGGVKHVQKLVEASPNSRIVVVTGLSSKKQGNLAVRLGAHCYMDKVDAVRIPQLIYDSDDEDPMMPHRPPRLRLISG